MRALSGQTRLAGVIGAPVRHSLSPALHNAAFAACGLDWVYLAFEVEPGRAADALTGVRALGIEGLSVTMPHKTDVADAVDVRTPAADRLRAVNTVRRRPDGTLEGHNTDGDGFVASLREAGADPAGRRVALLGAGGAGRALALALAGAGAADVAVINRSDGPARAAAELAAPVGRVGSAADVAEADLVVNATPVGMGDSAPDALPADPSSLHAGQVVVDIVVHPLDTAFLQAARAAGARTVDGLGMLVHQAGLAFTLWTGAAAPVAEMRAAAERELAGRARPVADAVRAGSSLNSMIRFLTAGESHGQGLVVIVEGLPAGLAVTVEDVQAELARRRLGYGRGPRMRFEQDDVTLLAGIRHGRTLGSPVAIEIANTEWTRSDKWHEEMSPAPGATKAPLTQPRPGHADLAGMQKYGFTDARDVLERASARETAARVAAGAVAKLLLRPLGIEIISHVIQMGTARAKAGTRPTPADLDVVDSSPVRCFDAASEEAMVAEVEGASKAGDSLGGVVEVLAYGVPVGLGSHVHWDRKLDGLLAQALMSIQAVKGVEVGDGFEVASRRGSDAHDPIVWDASAGTYRRESTLAGGVEGGMTTGDLVVVRAAMKPLATLNRPTLRTVDTVTKEETLSFKERTDVTAVPAMGVVAETMVALVLANEAQRKFGGDSLDELVRNADAFRASL